MNNIICKIFGHKEKITESKYWFKETGAIKSYSTPIYCDRCNILIDVIIDEDRKKLIESKLKNEFYKTRN